MRRLLNIVTALSLLLSLAAAGMWVRSQFVTEGWESDPRPSGMNYEGRGWYRHRVVESAGGRLVYADYRYFVRGEEPPPDDSHLPPAIRAMNKSHPRGQWRRPPPTFTPPSPGYRQSAAPLTPDLRGRVPESDPRNPPSGYGSIPGVAEWWIAPRYGRRFIAVSWLPLALAFAVLPAGRGVLWWRRWRQRRLPAFPVLPREFPLFSPAPRMVPNCLIDSARMTRPRRARADHP